MLLRYLSCHPISCLTIIGSDYVWVVLAIAFDINKDKIVYFNKTCKNILFTNEKIFTKRYMLYNRCTNSNT